MAWKLGNLLRKLNVKKFNAKNFGWTLSNKFHFLNFKFMKAKFSLNLFWHNLIVCNRIKDRYW